MGAITACRTALLGGHVEQCDDCGATRIAYNSCRNRHCPKCQGLARAQWLAQRQAELLPVPYFHVVFTLPASVGEIAFQNKAALYAMLFRAAAETLATIAADPRHLGAKLGVTMVLHTWGQTLQHHPHVHCVVPGGGPSLDGTRWVACRPSFFLPVRVLSRLFRRLFLRELENGFGAGKLRFFGKLANLAEPQAFARRLGELRRRDWVVYAKPPFGGPEQVLAYLGRYTHRVAIANSRLLSLADGKVRFTWKDYRAGSKIKVMTLDANEFIRRFLLHTLPDSFHRIRHYGFLANGARGDSLALCHRLLDAPATPVPASLLTIGPKTIVRSPQPTSPSVPIAAAPCGGSQPCRAPATLSPSSVTRHDRPADADRDRARPQCCGPQCLQRNRAADQPLQPAMPSVPAAEVDAIAARSPWLPAARADKSPSARTPQRRTNVERQQAFATIPIVPNIPRLRSIQLL
jgi:hypothetical protein